MVGRDREPAVIGLGARRQRRGRGEQVTGSCRRLETGNTGGNIKHSDFLINYLREINSPLVMDLSLHCHCH